MKNTCLEGKGLGAELTFLGLVLVWTPSCCCTQEILLKLVLTARVQAEIHLCSAGEVARWPESRKNQWVKQLQLYSMQEWGHISPLEQIKFKTCQPQQCLGRFSSSALMGNKFEALRCHSCMSCFELFPCFSLIDLFPS